MAKTQIPRKPRQRKKRIEKLQNKYRLIIFNDESFAEIYSFRLTKINLFLLFGFVSIFMVTLVYLLIAYTPLKEYIIPDYPKLEEREKIIQNTIKVDSLEHQLQLYDQKLQILHMVINGDEPPQYMNEIPDSVDDFSNITFSRSQEDSLMRAEIQEFEALNVNFKPGAVINPKYVSIYFHTPVRGTVSNIYSPEQKHYAIDVVAPKNSVIHAVLPGIIVFNSWTVETGYTCIIQHSNNFISVYKHNSKLLKESGSKVEAGDGIAIIGNTGELTTGPHLHFELWHEGKPVNPQDYIVF
ncbi:MAG TPA: M23 family metallopeptidase [Bacteroidales bacterium]|nr:M23 family metallopeptidase [Bacteroidales bacterium]HPM13678.1 M23 family metallopeptidase [Bacteroidales bacterium]